MRRIVLEIRREGQWRVVGDLMEGELAGSLTLEPETMKGITFGFGNGRAFVLASESLASNPQYTVSSLNLRREPLAYLDEGPYQTEIHREGNVVPVRLRVEEAS